MAPPDRSDHPRDTAPVNDVPSDSRMRRNADELASWLEWLLHPEEHDYDRTVIYPPNGDRREEPGRRYQTGTTADPKGIELPFESVIEGYLAIDFFRAMGVVSTQEVERDSSLLGVGTAALYNVWWLADEGMPGLRSNFPSTWTGPASAAASDSVVTIEDVAGQLSKIATDLRVIPAKYAAVITGLRSNANNAAGELAAAFEKRFAEHDGVDLGIAGILVGAIAAATITYFTGGAAGMIVESAVGAAWTGTLTGAVSALEGEDNAGALSGDGWRKLAESYMSTQDDMLTNAKQSMDQLNSEVSGLLGLLKNDGPIMKFLEKHGV